MKPLIPALIWSVVIFILSTMPPIQLPETFFSPDKLAHVGVYAILTILWLRGFAKKKVLTKNLIFWILIGCAGYGCLMEIIQYSFFPGRYFEMGDNIANIIGCLIGWLIFSFQRKG